MAMRKFKIRSIGSVFAVLAVVTLLGGCQSKLQMHGKIPEPDNLALLRTGLSRSDIVDLLGSPTSKDPFDPRVWYYMSRQYRTLAFYNPTITQQSIVKIRFDATDHVAAIEQKKGFENVVDISPTGREIPSQGHSLGVLSQIFGNIGRFSGKAAPR